VKNKKNRLIPIFVFSKKEWNFNQNSFKNDKKLIKKTKKTLKIDVSKKTLLISASLKKKKNRKKKRRKRINKWLRFLIYNNKIGKYF
jgi:hypothetical protein